MISVPKPTAHHRPKRRVKASEPERDIQARAEELCENLGIRFFRIPDKLLGYLKVYAPTWVRVFCSRYLAGVPDLMLFRRDDLTGRNEVVFLEIKTEAGKLSPSQKAWHSGLFVKVAYGWSEVEKVIKDFYMEGA